LGRGLSNIILPIVQYFCNFEAFGKMMKKYLQRSLILLISGLLLAVVSCTPLTCFEDTESFVKASFYNNTTKLRQAPDSITLYGVGNENILLYKKALKVQPVLFAMNPSVNNCRYIIKINNITDTISFSYTSYLHLISKECGYTYYYTLSEKPVHTKNNIDSLSVTKGSITTLNEENIRIYY
jgi:hypothetical protein